MRAPARQVPDLVYGEVLGYRPLELDLYLPQTDGSAPVIVYLHGGGWRRGSRREPLPVLGADFYDRLTTQGFAVAAIDYRLSGEARFPAPLEDVRAAFGWVRDHASAYGLDADRVFGWGDSAGGHLVELLGSLLVEITGEVLGRWVHLVEGFQVVDHLVVEVVDRGTHDLLEKLEIEQQAGLVELGADERDEDTVVVAVRILALAAIVA